MPIVGIALLLAAALGGGTAVAAQQSLPGDLLWGFKVHVNKSVEGTLALSDQAKANWDITAIRTRLAEAQVLAGAGKLDAQAQADITANINEHAQGVAGAVAKLEQSGGAGQAADIAAHFQAVMAQSAASLGTAQASAGADAGAAPLLTTVHTVLDQASHLSAQTSADSSANATVSTSASTTVQGKPSIKGAGGDDEGSEHGGFLGGLFGGDE